MHRVEVSGIIAHLYHRTWYRCSVAYTRIWICHPNVEYRDISRCSPLYTDDFWCTLECRQMKHVYDMVINKKFQSWKSQSSRWLSCTTQCWIINSDTETVNGATHLLTISVTQTKNIYKCLSLLTFNGHIKRCNTVLAGSPRTITDWMPQPASSVILGSSTEAWHICSTPELHWLDVSQRIFHKLGVTVHRCLQGKAPQ